jgi:anti-sigma regulatory factor (Ser/Thr protein kinase)
MCQSTTVSYHADATAPRRARDFCAGFVAAALPDSSAVAELTDDTRLVVSELVTNAVAAGSAEVKVNVAVHRGHVRLAVDDYAPRWPRQRRATPDDANGRGLIIVAALSREWGVEYVRHGKQVWAEVPIAAGLTFTGPCHLSADA